MSKPDWSKLGRSSRNRGNSFERKVAKRMNELLGANKHRMSRTPTSGGHMIKGDLYEDPNFRTEWSNIEIYCRTCVRISLEALMCDEKSCAIKWIEETGINSIWILRNKPNRVFMLLHTIRIENVPTHIKVMYLDKYSMFELEQLPFIKLNLSKMEK